MPSRLLRCASAAALLLAATHAFGHGEGVLVQRQGDRLVTGYDSGSSGGQAIGARVFSSVMPSNGLTTDPSFVSVSPAPAGAGTLPVGEDLYWDFLPVTADGVTANLLHWDGAGELDLAAAQGAALTLYDPNFGVASVDGAAAAVGGLRIGTTTSSALALHAHRYWELASGSPAGVYVASLRLRMDGLLPTEPLYFAFATFGTPLAALSETVGWLSNHADTLLLDGDYNFDGTVDGADYGVWSQQYGAATPQAVTSGEADGNGDGVIDAADYTLWRDASMALSASSARAPIPVPEPASLLLALAPLVGRSRRNHAFAASSSVVTQ